MGLFIQQKTYHIAMTEPEMFDELQVEEQPELYEHYRVHVDKGQGLLRIDKYLTSRMEGVSRNKIQAAADAGCIQVNEKPVKSNYRVKGNDIVTVLLPHPVRELEILPENIPLEIVFEDEHLVIINKKPGMVVHPGFGNYTGTLQNALLYHFQQNKNSEAFPYLVHRIDKDTSGLIIVAKNEVAQTKLGKQFFDHSIIRRYQALVWGDFTENEGTITGNLARSLSNRKMMAVFPDGETGKHAVTHYNVIERFRYVTLVECRLETGRTHQIRAHFRYTGHPLFADTQYGGDKILKGTTFTKYKQFVDNCFKLMNRQALHAFKLGFIHPVHGELCEYEIALPADLTAVIEKWRKYSSFGEEVS
jgi:23S rRNA pseudouridine1911/1915/1917 synthase